MAVRLAGHPRGRRRGVFCFSGIPAGPEKTASDRSTRPRFARGWVISCLVLAGLLMAFASWAAGGVWACARCARGCVRRPWPDHPADDHRDPDRRRTSSADCRWHAAGRSSYRSLDGRCMRSAAAGSGASHGPVAVDTAADAGGAPMPPGAPTSPIQRVARCRWCWSPRKAGRRAPATGPPRCSAHCTAQSKGRLASSLFAMSSVSGGSVGAIGYRAFLNADPALAPDQLAKALPDFAGQDASVRR